MTAVVPRQPKPGGRPEPMLTGLRGVSPEVEHQASLLICAHATDAAEARLFLEMLGLVAPVE